MARDTVAVETRARLAISRMSITSALTSRRVGKRLPSTVSLEAAETSTKNMKITKVLLCAAAMLSGTMLLGQSASPQRLAPENSVINPLLPVGPDPWVEYKDGFYFYMNTTITNLKVWKTRSMADLKSAEKKIVWTAPKTGPYSHDIWAPEIHFLQGKWYIYFAADAEDNQTHRIYVIENSTSDPLRGEWVFKGKVADPADKWAIDASVFEDQGRLYIIWSGWEGDENGTQSIYIARLGNPWTVEGQRTRISTPEYPWEKVGDVDPKILPGNPPHIDVNEGPEVLKHGNTIV